MKHKVNVIHSLKCNMWESNPHLFARKARSATTRPNVHLIMGLHRVMWTFSLVWNNSEISPIHGKWIFAKAKIHLLGMARGETLAPKSAPVPSKCVSARVETHCLCGDGEILQAPQLLPRRVSGFSLTRKSVYLVRFVTCPSGNRHLLDLTWSFFRGRRRRRRRRRNVSHKNVQTRKLRLKVNYHVREHEKMGIYKKIWEFPKFAHFTALEKI